MVLAPPFFAVMVGTLRHLTGQTPFGGNAQAQGIVLLIYVQYALEYNLISLSLNLVCSLLHSLITHSDPPSLTHPLDLYLS